MDTISDIFFRVYTGIFVPSSSDPQKASATILYSDCGRMVESDFSNLLCGCIDLFYVMKRECED